MQSKLQLEALNQSLYQNGPVKVQMYFHLRNLSIDPLCIDVLSIQSNWASTIALITVKGCSWKY